jgi:hypothetical protein
MATHGCRELFASGLKRQDNDLLVIDSQAAAEVFKRRFEAIFAQGEARDGAKPVTLRTEFRFA